MNGNPRGRMLESYRNCAAEALQILREGAYSTEKPELVMRVYQAKRAQLNEFEAQFPEYSEQLNEIREQHERHVVMPSKLLLSRSYKPKPVQRDYSELSTAIGVPVGA